MRRYVATSIIQIRMKNVKMTVTVTCGLEKGKNEFENGQHNKQSQIRSGMALYSTEQITDGYSLEMCKLRISFSH